MMITHVTGDMSSSWYRLVVINSFCCIFLTLIQRLMSLYLTANHLWVFFVGPGPFVFLLCCFGDETQVWLEDLQVVLVCDFAVLCVDLPFYRYRPIALCIAFFTAYFVIRTVPQSIYGQTRGKKKTPCLEKVC